MTDVELRDELMTMLAAGHETTSTGLAFAVDLLLHEPGGAGAAARALDGDDDAYLDAVVSETLRLRPVIDAAERTLKAPRTIAGWDLPAGIRVYPGIALVHHREDLYPQPERFRPERFTEEGAESYTWLPFGGGIRRCIGAALAQAEMAEVLRMIFSPGRARRGPARARPGGAEGDHARPAPRRAGPGRRHAGRAVRGRRPELAASAAVSEHVFHLGDAGAAGVDPLRRRGQQAGAGEFPILERLSLARLTIEPRRFPRAALARERERARLLRRRRAAGDDLRRLQRALDLHDLARADVLRPLGGAPWARERRRRAGRADHRVLGRAAAGLRPLGLGRDADAET